MSGDPAERKFLPYALILALHIFCHWFILTNDGLIWDGWYWFDWLKTRNWIPMVEYTSAQALQYSLWPMLPFAYVKDIVETGMWASFLCLLAESILFYQLCLRLGLLPRGEALAITLLAQAIPTFSAGQDFPNIILISYRTLFLAAALLATLAQDAQGARNWCLRGAALVGFYFSCITNGALIVFFGALYLLLFSRYVRMQQARLAAGLRGFLRRYPDWLLLPPTIFAAKLYFFPQFGWYEEYNKPGSNLGHFWSNFWSFFQNLIPYHVKNTAAWFPEHPVWAVVLVALVVLWVWKAPRGWSLERGDLRTAHLAWVGGAILCFAILPLALGGKTFEVRPIGEWSRHAMLAGWPLAILLFAGLRAIFLRRDGQSSRWLPPVCGVLAVILGSQYLPVYVGERAEWIFSRSVLRNAVQNQTLRESSIIFFQGYSVAQQIIYGTYGFATAFGDRTRLVTPWPPGNQRYYVPSEIERLAAMTTAVVGEFKKIDPSGQQTYLQVARNRGDADDWALACRDLRLRYSGSDADHDGFLASLTTLSPTILRPAVSLAPGLVPGELLSPEPVSGAPSGNFINGAGMALVALPWSWWAARFETTQAQYERVMGTNPSLFKDPVRPVECVSWQDATAFSRRLTEQERQAGRLPVGFEYRLPTLAEFEQLATGSSWQEAVVSVNEMRWQTAPVGSAPANVLKLHDVYGNVWEWCLDWWDESRRFKRYEGGSWVNTAGDLARQTPPPDAIWLTRAIVDQTTGPHRRDHPDQGFWNRGFRCVLAPPVASAPEKGKR